MSDVGRNEPCPCGSGRKYKRCCHAKDREREASIAGGSGAQSPAGPGWDGAVTPRGEPAAVLPGRWGRAIDDIDLAPRSESLDAVGEPVMAITDRFTFPAAQHREVQAALPGTPGLVVMPGEAGDRGVAFTVTGQALPALGRDDEIILRLVLLEERIEMLTFDLAVADALVDLVQRVLHGLVRRGPREVLSPRDLITRGLSTILGVDVFDAASSVDPDDLPP